MSAPVVHEKGNEWLTLAETFNRGNRKTYGAGSHVNLDHCTDDERALLVDRGIVRHDPQGAGLKASDRYELQAIKGISAAKALALAEMGVTSLAEFVAMDDDAVARAAGALGVTVDKIKEYQTKAR